MRIAVAKSPVMHRMLSSGKMATAISPRVVALTVHRSRLVPRLNAAAEAEAGETVSEAGAADRASQVATSPKEVTAAVDAGVATDAKAELNAKVSAESGQNSEQASILAELLDSSEFGSRGEGWVAAQLAAFAVILLPPAPLTSVINSLAVLTLLVGSIFVAYSVFNLGKNITPLPEPRKQHELVTKGIYAYARHPMYGGVLMMALGLAVATHDDTRLVATALLWWILEQKVTLEEAALAARYPEYAEYKDKVKKFIPFVY